MQRGRTGSRTVERVSADGGILGSRGRLPQHVVYREFVNETVLLNLETGQYHGVNPTGAKMIEALERADTVGQAAQAIAERFEMPLEQVEQDISVFCKDLGERGLVLLEEKDTP